MTDGVGLILPQAFVAGAAPLTRRGMLCQGGSGSTGLSSAYTDTVSRFACTLPVTPTRCRFRIRNSNAVANTVHGVAINLNGVWIGVPATSGLTIWGGAFTGAPTQVVAAATIDAGATGAEFVSPWFTNTEITAYQPFGVSLGFTTSTGAQIDSDFCPGLAWGNASVIGVAAQAGNAAVPASGTLTKWIAPLDVRMEYEYVGNNPIGLFLGDSLTMGVLNPLNAAFGLCGPDEEWPHMACLRMAHSSLNGAIDGSSVSTFTGGTSTVAFQRMLDPTFPTLTWPGGCTPDYAVIALGFNDIGLSTTSLATWQTNVASLISALNTLGIFKIIICTVPPGGSGVDANGQHFMSGPLKAAVASGGSIATITVTIVPTTGLGGGGGYPGAAATWNGAKFYLGMPTQSASGTGNGGLDGPFTNGTAAEVTATLTLSTNTGGTAAQAHLIGDAVIGQNEGLRLLYNQWIRQHVIGTIGAFDLSEAVEQPNPTVSGVGQVNWKYFTSGITGPHPFDPSMYEVIASKFAGAFPLGL